MHSEAQNLASIRHKLSTVRLLVRRRNDLEHATHGILHFDRSLAHAKELCCFVSHLRLRKAWIQDKGVQPFVFGVDSHAVPIQ